MTTEARLAIADSRALYFSDFTSNDSDSSEASTVEDSCKRKPSYVGLSHSVNGYTPYAPYNGRQKKISPPLQIPVSPPHTLDSVTLVLNQDSYQKSVTEFESVMRDLSNTSLDMGRPDRNTDITDNAKHVHNEDSFFPTTHSKQIISDGEGGRAVEIVTKFHSDDMHSPTYTSPGGSRQNLVQKQIERLYGDTMSTVRMTSPEPRDSPERICSPQETNGILSDESLDSTKPERKISGGFFAKRFGISKMKDHSTRKDRLIDTNSTNNSPMEFKPLKVPAVFRLLRPEFREQLKQSSCKVAVPGEEPSKERIIPIRREVEEVTPDRILPIKVVSPIKNGVVGNGVNSVTSPRSEKTLDTAERVIPIRRESGGITVTPRRPAGLVAPKVNGFSPAQQASAMGLRQNGISRPAPAVVSEVKNGKPEKGGAKQSVVRKLSPLSPKHIVLTPSSSEKPAITPKPEHLKSPPMSPTPPASPTSPPLQCRRQTVSPVDTPPPVRGVSPVATSPPVRGVSPVATPPPVRVEPVSEPPAPQELSPSPSPLLETPPSPCPSPSLPVETQPVTVEATIIPQTLNNNNNNQKEMEQLSLDRSLDSSYEDNEDEYPEEFYQDYPHQAPHGGIRERELLCPIMEEDNESTASGSTCNLATPKDNNAVIGGLYSPDDPFLATQKGEVQDGNYFIKVLENEIFHLEEQICDWEEELNTGVSIPEDTRDTIITVVGMGKLLMAQKLTQFRGLCDKNIHVTKEEDPFVATNMDLAGFWDMVHIQVEQIHTRFQALRELKTANWIIKAPEVQKNNKPKAKKAVTLNKPIKPKVKSDLAKTRDEARKKMLEDRKRAMKENKPKEEEDLIIIM
jgi:hypothetical protein